MKLLIVFLMALACAQALFPKLTLELEEEDDDDFIKIPKLNLFPKPFFLDKLIKKKEKLEGEVEKKLEKLEDKKDQFEAKLLGMLDDKNKGKVVFDKLSKFQPPCPCSPPDDCTYFS